MSRERACPFIIQDLVQVPSTAQLQHKLKPITQKDLLSCGPRRNNVRMPTGLSAHTFMTSELREIIFPN
jgi:hypothetical protein